MKAVIPEVPPFVLEWRRKTGADRWDEMWEGVLHMPPAPSLEHQDFEGALERWLHERWARPRRGKVYHNVNVAAEGGWPDDYRIPDLTLLARSRFGIRRGDYLEGAPNVVVEILSPDDETREKMAFYAGIGVPEVWVLDRDARTPEVYILRSGEYEAVSTDAGGWLRSPGTKVRLRPERRNRLAVQMGDDRHTRLLLPED